MGTGTKAVLASTAHFHLAPRFKKVYKYISNPLLYLLLYGALYLTVLARNLQLTYVYYAYIQGYS